MSEIPDDIMKVADAVARTFYATPFDKEIDVIARAILAERERCAAIVRCGCDNPSCELDEKTDEIMMPDAPEKLMSEWRKAGEGHGAYQEVVLALIADNCQMVTAKPSEDGIQYYANAGPWTRPFLVHPTHWMPLPDAPKA